MENTEEFKNVMRDTRKEVRYEIIAPRKLTRDEMLRQIRNFNFKTENIRQKAGATVQIIYDDNL